MSVSRLRFAALLQSLAVAWGAVVCLPAWGREHVAVQLSRAHQFQFAGYYVAKARGLYSAVDLEVELRPGGPSAIRPADAVSNGRAEFGVGGAGLAIDRMDGAPLVALAALLQSSPAVWVAPGSRDKLDLRAWQNLQRRLTSQPRDATELLIPFSRPGAPAQVASAPLRNGPAPGFADAIEELREASLSGDLYPLEQAGVAFTILEPRDFGVDFYGEVLFTSESYLGSHPAVVSRFRDATLRGWELAFADLEGTARLIREQYAPDRSVQELSYEGRVLRERALLNVVELGHMSRRRWAAIGQLQRDHGFGRAPLEVDGFVHLPAESRSYLLPDPIRITFAGMLAALLLASFQLLRSNTRLIRDNRALIEAGNDRQAEEQRFHFLMDVAPFPIVLYDLADGKVLYANDRALSWADLSDMMGHPLQAWIPSMAPDGLLGSRLCSGRLLRDQEVELVSVSNRPSRWCSINGRAIEFDGKRCAYVTLSDITDRKAAEREVELLSEQRALVLRDVEQLQARLREASTRDALTGLHNRRYFESTADREFARCRRENSPVGMLVVDADHFKKVNDRYGHAGGDDVLRSLGALLAAMFRTEDVVCRIGGEEFVVLMPGAEEQTVLDRAEALRNAVGGSEVQSSAGPIRFTVSIGAAVGDPVRETPAALFARADAAVYAAKSGGRNRVEMAPGLPAREADSGAPSSVAGTSP